ncbi:MULTISPECIES: ubiquinone biosynthesis accessory factor UbiJ [Cupriavidus]|uniref:Ubiquinone biosynthesis accessory factor UbiJ n=1 Tax=Cupriavidus pinatubonensis (strain JMP 134 / LMG 1197) TaxID=264198 RepID=Q475W8_CUPPJ|nr:MULTISPECIES: SCP2 sterol-binding domain-containing protein [Cupriavidus]QYY32045.1 SCP2 sterol-binding domain-containing protein [Cupriavidus pinatubonensis]TPQ43758.1 SCP2 domain-containing protein [Cupriavidus pinatubonensis]
MNPLPSALAAPAVAALNHLLEQEPWARSQLVPFAGRVIRFDAAAFALSLRVTEDGTTELAPAAEAPAVSLLVPLQQWPLVAADVADGGQPAAMRHVRLEGDAELANTVSMLARNLRWDAAEDLSRAFRGILGGPVSDSLAQRMVDGARQVHEQATRVGRTLVENVTEYLLDENPTLVRHVALEDFSSDVGRVRDDLARLEKRLERLERTRPAGPAALPSAHR